MNILERKKLNVSSPDQLSFPAFLIKNIFFLFVFFTLEEDQLTCTTKSVFVLGFYWAVAQCPMQSVIEFDTVTTGDFIVIVFWRKPRNPVTTHYRRHRTLLLHVCR